MNLIYLVCGGDPVFVKMAEISIQKLRTIGEYEDDIAILTDNEDVDIGQDLTIEISKQTNRHEYKKYKCKLHNYIDVKKYDKIIFIDVDAMAIKPVKQLFDHVKDRGKVCFFKHGDTPLRSIPLLTASENKELLKEAAPLIASGFFCVAAEQFVPIIGEWDKANEKYFYTPVRWIRDMYVLNYLICKKMLPFGLYPEWTEYINFNKRFHENYEEIVKDKIILQFNNVRKRKAIKQMNFYNSVFK